MALFGWVKGMIQTFLVERDKDGGAFYEPLSATPEQSSIAAIYGAINMLGHSASALNKRVVRRIGTDDPYYEAVPDHPLNVLLESPSPFMDGGLLWESIARELCAKGNIYLWVRRTTGGYPASLWPGQALRSRGRNDTFTFYPWPLDGQLRTMELPRRSVVGIHGPGFNGVESPSPIWHAAMQTSRTMAEAQEYQYNRLRLGLNAQTVIETDPSLDGVDPDVLRENAKKINAIYGGARNAGAIPVLFPGYSLKAVGTVSAADLQVVELLRWGVEDIARVWNFNPVLLGIIAAGTRPLIRELAEGFTRWTLKPVVDRLQGALTFGLMPTRDRANNLEIQFDLDRSRIGTFRDQVEAIELAVTRGGLLTINEGRARLGYPPYPGGDVLLKPKGSPSDPTNSPQPSLETDDPDPDVTEQVEQARFGYTGI